MSVCGGGGGGGGGGLPSKLEKWREERERGREREKCGTLLQQLNLKKKNIPPGFLLPSLSVREQKPLVLHRRCGWSVQLVLCVRQVFFEAGVKRASRFADVEFSFLAASFLWFACLFFPLRALLFQHRTQHRPHCLTVQFLIRFVQFSFLTLLIIPSF